MANTIKVSVLGDVKDINRKLGNVEKQLGGFGSKMKGLGTAVAGAFAGGAIINGIKDVVTSASDLNETVSKTETIFGKGSPAIMKWADGASKALGLSKQEALDGVSTFGNFFDQIGIGTEQASKMSREFVQASVDLGSFHNAAAPDVMEALTAATRGEYDSLQKYIPTINAARVEQEALAATHKKSAKELTDQDKAMAVHSLVMKGQGAAAGDFAKTQGSLANQTKIAKAEFENAKVALGNGLLPMFTKFANWLTSEGIPRMKEFATWFKENLLPPLKEIGTVVQSTVLPALQGIGTFMLNNAPLVLTFAAAIGTLMAIQKVHAAFMAVQAVGGLIAYVAQMNIVQAVTRTWAAVQWVLNAAMAANPIGIVIIAIVALVAAIVIAWKNSETFRNVVTKAWNAIKAAASAVFGWIKNFISGAFKFLVSLAMNFTLPGLLIKHWDTIKNATAAAWNWIKAQTSAIWNSIKTALSNAWSGIVSAVRTGISKVRELAAGIKDKILSALSNAGNWLKDAGRNIIQGLIGGITDMAGRAVQKIKDVAGNMIDAAKSILRINSPSKVFRDIGSGVGEGLVLGIHRMNGEVKKAGGDMANAVANGFSAPTLALSTSGAAGGTGNTYNITVEVPVGAAPEEIGRTIVEKIGAYENVAGNRWRN